MGILDDLKNQSDNKKADEERERLRQTELLKYYEENINPKMLHMYSFLNELIEHLNYIKKPTKVSFPIRPDGSMQEFEQGDYKVTIDSIKIVKDINLRFNCKLKEPLTFELENNARILNYTDLLHSYRIDFDRTDNQDDNYNLISAKFKINGPMQVNVVLQGDIANSSISILLNNFEKPGAVKHTFKERHITEKFIDSFGKFIIRQNPGFLKLDIANEHKEKIRQNIQVDLKRRQKELDEVEHLLELEQSKEKEKKSWKNIFKKID